MSSMKKKLGIWASLVLVLALVATAVFPATGLATTYPITVTDDLGREVTIAALPVRIISLTPSNTEILFALGLGDRVVGVSDYSDYPPEALEKEKIGGPYLNVNIEKIVALQPDFILAAEINTMEVINTLAGHGLTVFGIKSTDLDDLLDDINTVGRITDKEAEATILTDDMQSRIDAVTSKTAGLTPEERPRTFHICWHDPIWTAGSGTYIHDLIERVGGTNIFADIQGYQAVDIETVIWRDPEVIIVTAMGGTAGSVWEWVNTEPRLAGVSARQNGRVYYAESNWVERPGPRIVLGLEQVAKYIHPGIFFDPWDYDKDDSGTIEKSEAIKAVQDYFNGLIAKAQTIQVVMLYFG
ncbi:MAG: cobalamin-binding protein [Chloroflexi bacterium CG07_land_8_20_14_0_80_45_17]|nr:MAG: cobalamin-binding protein [Chloroflexi bacterium CG07_land_8_20_14_0_80_45_17]